MNVIKIGIVEDEVIIAFDIEAKLKALGYAALAPCGSYESAVKMLAGQSPDLVILDINLAGKNEGIEIAKYIRQHLNIPFIFLTANSDAATVAAARQTMPDAYLLKPFNKDSLYSTIEIALYNFNQTKAPDKAVTGPGRESKNFLFVKIGDYFHRVVFDDILYMESEHNYVNIYTAKKKFPVRATMQEFMEHFDPKRFVRVHRGYVANIDKIEKVNASSIIINGNEVPISNNYRDNLLAQLNIW